MVVLDSKATIIEFEKYSEILGYKEEELIGKNWFDVFIEADNMVEILDVFYTLFSTGDIQAIESYVNDIRTKDGKHLLMDFENTMFKNSDGELLLKSFAKEYFKA